jgi:hypothetical protein
VYQSIGGGTGSGMGIREKSLKAAIGRCQRFRSAPHFNHFHARPWLSFP